MGGEWGAVTGAAERQAHHHTVQPTNARPAEGSKSLLPCAKICQRVVKTEERFSSRSDLQPSCFEDF